MNKQTYVGIFIIMIIVIGQVLYVNRLHMQNTTLKDGNSNYSIQLHVSLKVYKNGKLVYYDPDDPPTDSLFRLLAHILDANAYRDSDDFGSQKGIRNYFHSYVVLVTSSIPYSHSITYDDISSNMIKSSNVISDNIKTHSSTGDLVLTITKSLTMSSSQTIYGIGYLIYLGTPSATLYSLVLYDYLSNSISVSVGDVITVVYEIHLPVSNQYPS